MNGCWVANYNCSGRISGTKEAVALAGEKVEPEQSTAFKGSGAFHLRTYESRKNAKVLDELIRDVQIPYVADINAEIVTDKNDIKKFDAIRYPEVYIWNRTLEK